MNCLERVNPEFDQHVMFSGIPANTWSASQRTRGPTSQLCKMADTALQYQDDDKILQIEFSGY